MEEEYKYDCIECDYHTNNRSYWYQHKKTKKHLKNTSNIVDIKYNCNLCNYHTNKKQCWYQHNKTKKHIKNKLIEDNRLEQVEIQNQKDKEERELNIKEEEIIIKKKELELKERN